MKFTSPPKRQEFNERVWDLARKIPRGKVASYGQLALMLAPPAGVEASTYRAFGPRWVGGAMAACPSEVPWQRVLNSQGKISKRPGAEKQRKMLEAEGVVFKNDRVDLKIYGWTGTAIAKQARQKSFL
ncbi:MAG: MGMT family protein [Anaerolineales bacterium]|jgi:methylated-DNA-protein-cysteine methyltransferase-like protein